MPPQRALVLAGPCGAGKTTIGTALAATVGAAFVDGDDHHTPAAVASVARGAPLDDAYRRSWLATVASAAGSVREEAVVVACSALAVRHRAALRAGLAAAGVPSVAFAVLAPPKPVLRDRLDGREGHFLRGGALLPSQLATLELPDAAEPDAAVFGGAGVTSASRGGAFLKA